MRDFCILAVLMFFLQACGGGGSSSEHQEQTQTGSTVQISIQGTVQKGPFIAGGTVRGYALGLTGNRSALYVGAVTDSKGDFQLDLPDGPIELVANGHYINERSGQSAVDTMTLKSLSPGNNNPTKNINLLTHLAAERALHLAQDGVSVEAAWAQARTELANTLGLLTDAFDELNILDGVGARSSENADLLLFSAALQETADNDSTLSVNTIIDTLATEFRTSGTLPSSKQSLLYAISRSASSVDLDVDIHLDGQFTLPAHQALFSRPETDSISWRGVGYLQSLSHILITGQSLALGGRGGPRVTITPDNTHLMFKGGLESSGSDDLSTLVPLSEDGVETVASGFANYSASLVVQSPNYIDKPVPQLLLSISAIRGKKLEEIDKRGGDPFGVFSRSLDQVAAGYALAPSIDKPYSFAGILFIQGEADQFTDALEYSERLIALRDDYQKDISALTDQYYPVPLFTYQTGSSPDGTNVPLAQLKASALDKDIYLVTPTYHLPYTDGTHLTNHGYRWLGHYFAKAVKAVVYGGTEWKPLAPIEIIAVGKDVRIRFNVPVPPLVIDTRHVNDPGDYGFELQSPVGQLQIQSVSIRGPDEILIRSAVDIEAGTRVTYARNGEVSAGPTTGPRGNLRDSDASIASDLDSNGSPYLLYNWCVVFDKEIRGSFTK